MKKTLALGLLALGLSTNCFAYDNAAAGYSIKEGNPMFLFESNNTLAYSDYTDKSLQNLRDDKNILTHTAVLTLTKEEMSKQLGVDFTTNYFNQELEKIALDKGKTDPKSLSKLADRKIYITNKELQELYYEEKDLYEKEIDENTIVTVKKVGKGRALEFNQYVVLSEGATTAVKTTVVSANDRVYTILTIGVLSGSQKDLALDKEKTQEASKPEIKIIKEQDLDSKKVKQLKAVHNKTLKSFKTFVPTEKEHVFGYTDSLSKKFIELPDDWFYGRVNFNETLCAGTLTFASNLEDLVKAFKEANNYRTLHKKDQKNEDGFNIDSYEESIKIFLSNFNGFKASLGLTMYDDSIKGIFGYRLQTKLLVDQTLRDCFKRADQFGGPNFKLNKYDFYTSFTETDGNIDIETLVTLYKTFTYTVNSKSEISATKNTVNGMLDVNKVQGKIESEVADKEASIVTQKNSELQ